MKADFFVNNRQRSSRTFGRRGVEKGTEEADFGCKSYVRKEGHNRDIRYTLTNRVAYTAGAEHQLTQIKLPTRPGPSQVSLLRIYLRIQYATRSGAQNKSIMLRILPILIEVTPSSDQLLLSRCL